MECSRYGRIVKWYINFVKKKSILAVGKDAFVGWRLTLGVFSQELSLLFCFVFAFISRQERISHGPKAHQVLGWLASKPQGDPPVSVSPGRGYKLHQIQLLEQRFIYLMGRPHVLSICHSPHVEVREHFGVHSVLS